MADYDGGLAGHLAGIRYYGESDFAVTQKGAPHYDNVSAALGIFRNDPLLFQPGTKYSYSSYGWNLISAVMEGTSGDARLRHAGTWFSSARNAGCDVYLAAVAVRGGDGRGN